MVVADGVALGGSALERALAIGQMKLLALALGRSELGSGRSREWPAPGGAASFAAMASCFPALAQCKSRSHSPVPHE